MIELMKSLMLLAGQLMTLFLLAFFVLGTCCLVGRVVLYCMGVKWP